MDADDSRSISWEEFLTGATAAFQGGAPAVTDGTLALEGGAKPVEDGALALEDGSGPEPVAADASNGLGELRLEDLPSGGEVVAKGLVELRQLFDTLDVDHDGKVTGQEWGKTVKQNQTLLAKYFGGNTLKEIGSAFKRIDTDGNASLSWEEFVAAAGLSSVVALHDSAARELPPAADPSGAEGQREDGGASDEDDLRKQAMATIDAGIRLAKEAAAGKGLVELRQLFDTLDVDHDGKVTGQEWGKKVKQNQTLLAKYFGGSTLKEIGSAFKRIDKDGNASLSWEEFVAAAGLSSAVAQHDSASRELPPAADPSGAEGQREQRGASDEDDLRKQAMATIDAGIRLAKEAAAGK